MRLSEFIRSNTKEIIGEWESFAQKLVPPAEGMSPLALRNHIVEILGFIVEDIESSQTNVEQIRKSHGQKAKISGDSAAEVHASLRQAGGFNLDQMVSEYRALRASVVKLWGHEQATSGNDFIVEDLIRFNESIDQELTESISYYTRASDHSRDIFLGVLGHDLRNPIGAVQMSAQLSLKMGGLSERQTMLAQQITESTMRATEIINTLLDLTRARLGSGFPVIRKNMDIGFVSRQLVDEMRAMHPDRKFTLEIHGATEGEWDKPRIGQIFSNLIGNAIQYGFTDLPVAVTITGHPDNVFISVHNDGVPIQPDKIGRIFDALNRGGAGDRLDRTGSTNLGLGLYITKEIVAAHGGTISVSSSEKDGTTFTARLPRH